MAFGPIMKVDTGQVQVELAPFSKDNLSAFVSPGMQQASVTQFLQRRSAPVIEDELEWYEKVRTDKHSLTWGIYTMEGEQRILIGTTALHDIARSHVFQATSGSMICNKEYWGRGIASGIHKARTWYGFQHLGLHQIKSAVMQGNMGSLKALMKSGYEIVSVERNITFVDGKLLHQDNLECVNPNEPFWSQWWNGDPVPESSLVARERSIAAMQWAQQHVTLL